VKKRDNRSKNPREPRKPAGFFEWERGDIFFFAVEVGGIFL